MQESGYDFLKKIQICNFLVKCVFIYSLNSVAKYLIIEYSELRVKSVIFQIILGLLISFLGFFLAYIYVTNIEKGSSPWLLVLSIVIVVIGVFFLFRAGTNIQKLNVEEPQSTIGKGEPMNLAERNNKLLSEWIKTTETENRLKLLKLSAEAEEK